jgi:hypothetical protein
MDDAILTSMGGQKSFLMGSDPDDPANVTWNFGVVPAPEELNDLIASTPPLHDLAPAVQGKWDGVTEINHFNAAVKVLGSDGALSLIQQQPRGTCGGRAGSAGGDFAQCIQIASGVDAKFHRVSHAAVYYAARKKYGMLKGSWTNDRNDGVASGSVPEALSQVAGYVQRAEIGDESFYGAGSDDLACKLGAGMLPELAAKIIKEGADNFIIWAPVRSAQEMADGIAAGGIGIISDSQGYTGTRDKDGFCRASGTWYHYHLRVGVVPPSKRKGFAYWQSWGKSTPGGTLLPGYPPNVFGVDWDADERNIRNGHAAVIFNFPLWELQEGGKDITWRF